MIAIKQVQWRKRIFLSIVIVLTIMSAALIALQLIKTSNAASGKDFNAGRIIDDAIFYNRNSMANDQIQQFLNSKVPACDTNGQQISEFGGPDLNGDGKVQRWEWGKANYNQTVFTCLRDYSQSTPDMAAASGLCGGIAGGTKTAAQIINDVAKACNINPQVLLVLLNKEQSLVTDTWPLKQQYDGATGFDCPDTAPCDPNYAGFFYQVYHAARQFQIYKAYPNDFNYIAGRNNNIYWNPDLSRCGSSSVFIQNQATAALYIYTPYQPNQAALNNLYGTGDSCSAYGNRNFWRMFTDWFGSTTVVNLPGCTEATNTARVCVWELTTPSGQQYLTPQNNERDELVTGTSAYQYTGKAFFANTLQLQGNIPVYRLISPNGGTFITADKNEYDGLVTAGYTAKGIVFYADPGDSNSGYPVYRLYSTALGRHKWTMSKTHTNELKAQGYTLEGVSFTSISTVRQEVAAPAGQSLTYRFSGMPGNTHFWTTDVNERDSMIRSGYSYEGISWNTTKAATTVPVYRLYSPVIKRHLYTKDAHEKNVLASSGDWIYEDISWYGSTSGNPVYRMYSKSTHAHLYTADANEKNFWVSRGMFVDEGVAWYQP